MLLSIDSHVFRMHEVRSEKKKQTKEVRYLHCICGCMHPAAIASMHAGCKKGVLHAEKGMHADCNAFGVFACRKGHAEKCTQKSACRMQKE